MCARGDVCRGRVWIGPDEYACLCVGVVPVCTLVGACEGLTGENPEFSKTEALELDEEGVRGRMGYEDENYNDR